MLSGRIYDKTGFVMPVGSILPYVGQDAPEGWLLCDGSTYKKADYPDLYVVIGETYDLGSGSDTQFSLPDLKARFPVGISENDSLGATGGEDTVELNKDHLPFHSHRLDLRADGGEHFHKIASNYRGQGRHVYGVMRESGKGEEFEVGEGGEHTHHITGETQSTGKGQGHENRPPYLALNYIIKY